MAISIVSPRVTMASDLPAKPSIEVTPGSKNQSVNWGSLELMWMTLRSAPLTTALSADDGEPLKFTLPAISADVAPLPPIRTNSTSSPSPLK